MRILTATLVVIVFALCCVKPARSQEIDAFSWIDYDPASGDVVASCEVDSDYMVQEDYDLTTHCEIDNTDNWELVASGSASDYGSGAAPVYLEAPADLGTDYQVVGDYSVDPNYWASMYGCQGPCEYYDPFNFYYFTFYPVDEPSPWWWYGEGPEEDNAPSVMSPGGTYQAVKTPTPTYFEAVGYVPLIGGCSLNTAGQMINVHYQVLDQSGAVLQIAQLTPQEHVVWNGQSTFDGYRPFATPQTTDNQGKFNDTPVGSCFGPPVPSVNYCVDVVQTFNAVYNSKTFPISTVTTGRDCVQGIRLTQSDNPNGHNASITQGTVN